MPELKATLPAATTKSSYNIRHFKAMHYPGRWPGWGGAFQWRSGTGAAEASAFSGGERRGFCCCLVVSDVPRTDWRSFHGFTRMM
jgi:hypothetical protein